MKICDAFGVLAMVILIPIFVVMNHNNWEWRVALFMDGFLACNTLWAIEQWLKEQHAAAEAASGKGTTDA